MLGTLRTVASLMAGALLCAGLSGCAAPVVSQNAAATSARSSATACERLSAAAQDAEARRSGFPRAMLPEVLASASDHWLALASHCPASFTTATLRAAQDAALSQSIASSFSRPSVPTRVASTLRTLTQPRSRTNGSGTGATNSATTEGSASAGLVSRLSPSDAAAFALAQDRLAFGLEFRAARDSAQGGDELSDSLLHREIASQLAAVASGSSRQCSAPVNAAGTSGTTGQTTGRTGGQAGATSRSCHRDPRQKLYSLTALQNAPDPVTDPLTGLTASLNATLEMNAALESAHPLIAKDWNSSVSPSTTTATAPSRVPAGALVSGGLGDTTDQREAASLFAAACVLQALDDGYPSAGFTGSLD